MSDTFGIKEARAQLGTLARRCAVSRERVVLTDHGQPVAVLINPQELADLEDELALARYQGAKATNTLETESHADVVRAVYGGGQAGDANSAQGAA